jgi:hypothetical protein
MRHILERYNHIVLSCHVVSQIMINNQSEQFVQEREINLIIELFEFRLHQYNTLIFRNIPHISQIVDSLAPLEDKKWRRLRITGLNPVGEQISFVSLIPQVLIKVSISNFLNRFNVINRNEMRI